MPKERAMHAAPAPASDGNASLRTERRVALVQQFPLFANLSQADCREIIAAARDREFARKDTIFLEGDPIRDVTLLTSGSAKLMQVGRDGTEVILRVVGTGDVVGMTSWCSAKCYQCSTAQALSDSTALVWEGVVFETLMNQFHLLRRNIANIISHCMQEMEERYREISTENVAARLSHQLLRLFSQVRSRGNMSGTLEINLSREELAQLTGTTLFTVSRLLSNWQQRGVVSTGRQSVSVHNIQTLRELAEIESNREIQR